MSTFENHASQLVSDLGKMPHRLQLAFGASCCERALPNYSVFFRKTGWGDPQQLRAALDRVWGYIEGGSLTLEEVGVLKEQVKAVLPDLDEFSSVEASAAQEAGLSVMVLLEYCIDAKPEHARRIMNFSRDTIDMFVQIRDNPDAKSPDFERRILEDDLMVREFQKEADDVATLRDAVESGREFVRGFRAKATANGQSHIGWS